MRIEHRDYTMEASSEGGFNLSKKVKREKGNGLGKKGTGEYYDDDAIIGYNMSLESCIRKIIHINHCSKDEVISLKEYIEMYRKEVNEIKKLIEL